MVYKFVAMLGKLNTGLGGAVIQGCFTFYIDVTAVSQSWEFFWGLKIHCRWRKPASFHINWSKKQGKRGEIESLVIGNKIIRQLKLNPVRVYFWELPRYSVRNFSSVDNLKLSKRQVILGNSWSMIVSKLLRNFQAPFYWRLNQWRQMKISTK